MSFPKGKGWNLISSNSVAGVYLPAYWLSNTDIHRLLNPGHLPTPALPQRLSLIFLWAEFSQRAPIPIFNPLQDTVYIVRGIWSAHSYLALPKNNKGTYWFWNKLISLCWLVQNVMTNWKCFGIINYGCSWTSIVDRHLHVFFITWRPTNSKWRVVL